MKLRNLKRITVPKKTTGKDLILEKIRDTLINLPIKYRYKRYTNPQLLSIVNILIRSNIKDPSLLILAFRNARCHMYKSERYLGVRYYSYGSCSSDFPESVAKEVAAEIPTGYVNVRKSGRKR